jgi:hypothetical protein
MKTEKTCVNCAALECYVRHECEDNELPIEIQELEAEVEDTKVIVKVEIPKLTEKTVPDNWVY